MTMFADLASDAASAICDVQFPIVFASSAASSCSLVEFVRTATAGDRMLWL